MTTNKLNPHDLRRVSVEAGADPRTVQRYLRGKPGASTADARIAAAIERLGLSARPATPEATDDECEPMGLGYMQGRGAA